MLRGSFAIPSSFGYQRFCSNYLATQKEGFPREILFTNEESPDYVLRQTASWPPPFASPAEQEVGLVVALDVKSGKHHPIYGMGRHNHENSVPIPGFGRRRVLGRRHVHERPSDESAPPRRGSLPAQSQLYSYIAKNTKELLADEGDLWAFVSDTPGVKNYYDVIPGSGTVVTGHFVKVPKDIATGRNADGTEIKAADKGYPLPPDERQLADRPPLRPRPGRHRRPPVGTRVLERPQQRLPVRPRRGHRLRQAAGAEQRRLHRRLGPGPNRSSEPRHAQLQVDERPRLEDGARPERSDDGDVAHRARRGRRQPRQDARRGPPAGQHRDDARTGSF